MITDILDELTHQIVARILDQSVDVPFGIRPVLRHVFRKFDLTLVARLSEPEFGAALRILPHVFEFLVLNAHQREDHERRRHKFPRL
jgi:hypothetical protein